MAETASFIFSYDFEGKIWETVIDPNRRLMVLEVRDTEEFKTGYKLFDFQTFEVKNLSFDHSDWWTTIKFFQFPLLILEKYRDPQNPSDKSLVLFDITKEEVFKEESDFQFEELNGTKLLGTVPGDRGKKREIELSGMGISAPDKASNELLHPVYYAPGTDSFKMVMEFLESDTNEVGCEYFEVDDYIIIGYYQRLGTKFERKLLVLKGDAEICHQTLDADMEGFASGSFFVLDRVLVFIENGRVINGIKLYE